MPDIVKRGYMPSDEKEFVDQIDKLKGPCRIKGYLSDN